MTGEGGEGREEERGQEGEETGRENLAPRSFLKVGAYGNR